MKQLIGIINLSTKVSNDEVKAMTVAIQTQLNEDVATNWGMESAFIIFYPDTTTMSLRALPIALVDSSDSPAAIGYHSEKANGKNYGMITVGPILQNGGAVLCDPNNPNAPTVSGALSHEVIEKFVDPLSNKWADGPQTHGGHCYAYKVCDPVSNDQYPIIVNKKTIMVSNFVFPEWFNEKAISNIKVDHLGKCNSSFSVSLGGHVIVRAISTEQEIYTEVKPPEWKLDMNKNSLISKAKNMVAVPPKKKKWWKYL